MVNTNIVLEFGTKNRTRGQIQANEIDVKLTLENNGSQIEL